jgi:acylphosphatase
VPDIEEMRARFRGRVQGVGFRMTACLVARQLGVSGRVCNLSDGSVDLRAQGRKDALLEFVRQLEAAFSPEDVTITFLPPKTLYTDFCAVQEMRD